MTFICEIAAVFWSLSRRKEIYYTWPSVLARFPQSVLSQNRMRRVEAGQQSSAMESLALLAW